MGLLQTIQKGRRPMPPRLGIYGTEGIGKSTFGSRAPAPVFVPTEDGLGETILEKTHRGHAWTVLHLLRERNLRGNYVRLSGEALAKGVGRSLAQNAIAQCVAALRERITDTMRDRLGLACGKHDVVDNRGGGYHLTLKVIVEVHDGEARPTVPAEKITSSGADCKAATKASTPGAALNERQRWVVGELSRGTKIRRADVERRFDVATRTVKRDLRELIQMSLIEFARLPRPGHYVLAKT